MQKRKLQVFISSTFRDLQQERQAAVETILSAGHIPAGMELFASGNESQMAIIKRWIDESDVYMLILGGCYGTVETKTGKSYTQLEYEYALDSGKPLFAIVGDENALDERGRSKGLEFIERKEPKKLAAFRKKVLTNISAFWQDTKDINIKTGESLRDIERRPDLIGWVPGNEAANPATANEIGRLSAENAELRKVIADFAATESQLTLESIGLLNVIFPIHVSGKARQLQPNHTLLRRVDIDEDVNLPIGRYLGKLIPTLFARATDAGVKEGIKEVIEDELSDRLLQKDEPRFELDLFPLDDKQFERFALILIMDGIIEPLSGAPHVSRQWQLSKRGQKVLQLIWSEVISRSDAKNP